MDRLHVTVAYIISFYRMTDSCPDGKNSHPPKFSALGNEYPCEI